MQRSLKIRRLPLEGTANTRDLGGYPCEGGGTTKWGVFLRSDCPHVVTENDIKYLLAYGVSHTVDLRREEERQQKPSVLEKADDFSGYHVSMSDQMHATNFEGDLPGSMSGLYISLLDESSDEIVRVFSILAEAKQGVLFHCAVGKDRTGVIAMLLLKLAGVSDADVIADYAITDIYMREIFDGESARFKKEGVPMYVLRSKPESMRRALEHLQKKYGTAQEYLLASGVSQSQLDIIYNKLVEK